MKRYYSLFIAICILVLCYIPFHSSAMNKGSMDIILDERIIDEQFKDVFVKNTSGEYFRILFEKIDGVWVEIDRESIVLRKTGLLDTDRHLTKDLSLDKAIDKKLGVMGLGSAGLPSYVDYADSPYLPPVGEQIQNSCVGWSVGYYLRTYQQAQDLGWNVKENGQIVKTHVFSPSFIYNQINEGVDEGSTLEDAGTLLKAIGAATLADFPYIAGDYLTQPSNEVKDTATLHKIRDWKILYTPNDSKEYVVQKTKEYLNTGDLPIIGIKVGFKWHYPLEQDGHSIITTEQYPMYGHAVAVVGYDDSIETPEGFGAFKIVNSWGTAWGDDGFAYLSYDALYNNMTAGYAYTDLINGPMLGNLTEGTSKVISPTQVKYDWNAAENVEGYKILDESYRVIANVYTNEYVETLSEPQRVTRYIQAFNSSSSSNLLKIEADTVTVIEEELPVLVDDDVVFTIHFNGTGQYGLVIKDLEGNTINKVEGLQAMQGQNQVRWHAVDLLGNPITDGTYVAEFYQGEKPIYETQFTKESYVNIVESQIDRIGDLVQAIDVELLPKKNGMLTLTLVNSGQAIVLVDNVRVTTNKPFVYQVTKEQVDFSNIDVSKAELKITFE